MDTLNINSELAQEILTAFPLSKLKGFIKANQTPYKEFVLKDPDSEFPLTKSQLEVTQYIDEFLKNEKSKPLRMIITGIAGT